MVTQLSNPRHNTKVIIIGQHWAAAGPTHERTHARTPDSTHGEFCVCFRPVSSNIRKGAASGRLLLYSVSPVHIVLFTYD